MDRRRPVPRGPDHARDDAGWVWIGTGLFLGGLVYVGVVLAWHAGFTAAAPFVIIPAVLVFMVGAGNLLSGKRPGRPAPRFNRPDPIPLSTYRRDGAGSMDPVVGESAVSDGAADSRTGPDVTGPGR